LTRCAEIIGAKQPNPENGQNHEPRNPQADPLRIAAALADISNDGPPDWEWWNKVGMATWAATCGNRMGFEAWNAWSARNEAHDPEATRKRWEHFRTSPPRQVGAGTMFHMAKEARCARANRQSKRAEQGGARTQATKREKNGVLLDDFHLWHVNALAWRCRLPDRTAVSSLPHSRRQGSGHRPDRDAWLVPGWLGGPDSRERRCDDAC
jgi:hypothetical protein